MPGTELGLQLAATLQEPPLVFVQVFWAAAGGKMKTTPKSHSLNNATRSGEKRTQRKG